jgi:hypothetical protein
MAAATSPAGTHLETHSKVLMGLWKEKGGGKQKKKSCLGKNMNFKNSCVLENACWFFSLFSRAWIGD